MCNPQPCQVKQPPSFANGIFRWSPLRYFKGKWKTKRDSNLKITPLMQIKSAKVLNEPLTHYPLCAWPKAERKSNPTPGTLELFCC